MFKHEFNTVTIITADRDKYLKLVNVDNSEEIIGKPERIILNNKGNIPEFEEVDLIEVVKEVVEEKPVKKTTKKTTKK